MWFVIGRAFVNYFKNPLYYIGAILIFMFTYINCNAYLNISYFNQESIEEFKSINNGAVEIYNGYLPATEKEIFDAGLIKLENSLLNELKLDKRKVSTIISKIRKEKFNLKQIKEYMESYNYKNAQLCFVNDVEMKKGTIKELNTYILEKLKQENYSKYFARKVSDFLSVGILIYSMILLAFLYKDDYKSTMYELIHTKPIKSWKYIIGKALGGILAINVIVIIIVTIWDIMICIKGNNAGLPVNPIDIWPTIAICNLPIVFYVGFIYTFITSVFKTSLPAIPFLFLHLVYSNLGQKNDVGVYLYKHRPFSAVIRFPGEFFSTKLYENCYFNQMIIIIFTIVIAVCAVIIFGRRRVL
ncbi:hypothetical protein PV797_05095 [Clostridiaceae bacterium M8S5]|nr:hypothetical protein PV797_05095 [Clostridiaceae bacterium M8S5]